MKRMSPDVRPIDQPPRGTARCSPLVRHARRRTQVIGHVAAFRPLGLPSFAIQFRRFYAGPQVAGRHTLAPGESTF